MAGSGPAADIRAGLLRLLWKPIPSDAASDRGFGSTVGLEGRCQLTGLQAGALWLSQLEIKDADIGPASKESNMVPPGNAQVISVRSLDVLSIQL